MMSARPSFTDQDYELLSAYLDDELADAARGALEQRLATDPALRSELAALRTTIALVEGLPLLQAPRDFVLTPEKLRYSPLALPPVWRRPRAALSVLTAAAAALLVFGGALVLLSQSSGRQMPLAALQSDSGAVAGQPTTQPSITSAAAAPILTAPAGETLTAETFFADTTATPETAPADDGTVGGGAVGDTGGAAEDTANAVTEEALAESRSAAPALTPTPEVVAQVEAGIMLVAESVTPLALETGTPAQAEEAEDAGAGAPPAAAGAAELAATPTISATSRGAPTATLNPPQAGEMPAQAPTVGTPESAAQADQRVSERQMTMTALPDLSAAAPIEAPALDSAVQTTTAPETAEQDVVAAAASATAPAPAVPAQPAAPDYALAGLLLIIAGVILGVVSLVLSWGRHSP